MIGMIDIHAHILPGIDDGAVDMNMSLEMIDIAYNQGVRGMIATPHYYPGHRNCSYEECEDAYRSLKEQIISKYTDLELYLGREIYYKDEVVDSLRNGSIHTMAGTKYVLTEFPTGCEYKLIEKAVRKLVQAGFYPIIAHAERYACLRKNWEQIEDLAEAGAYYQINAENFGRGLFHSDKQFCKQMLKRDLVHFIGSDCHNTSNRKPNICLAKKYVTQDLLIDNPHKLLNKDFV